VKPYRPRSGCRCNTTRLSRTAASEQYPPWFTDPSGGSSDSSHRRRPPGKGRIVIDAVRERRPPHPDAVTPEFAQLFDLPRQRGQVIVMAASTHGAFSRAWYRIQTLRKAKKRPLPRCTSAPEQRQG
jgi:hypothetical protein